MEPPEKPDQSDCCNSGCTPCIFDVYENQVKQYEEYLKNKTDTPPILTFKNVLSPIKYIPFTVVRIEDIGDCHKLFTFQYQSLEQQSVGSVLKYSAGQHFILRCSTSFHNYNEETESSYFSRPYTPIKSDDFVEINKCNIFTKELKKSTSFQIIVRLYSDGAMSRYLSNIKVGDVSYWRGPFGSYQYVPNKYKHILMVSQGTGIVPLYTILLQLLKNDEELSVLTLYCCFKNIQNILLRDELYKLKSNWNFKYNLFLSESFHNDEKICDTKYNPKYKEPIIYEKLSHKHIKLYLSKTTQNVLILLCGSEKFVAQYKNDAVECGIRDDCIISF